MQKALIPILFLLYLGFGVKIIYSAQTSAIQAERSQELLEKERTLRKRIEEEKKVFISKIVVLGVNEVNLKELRGVVLPYEKHWFFQKDIQQICELLREAYQKSAEGKEGKFKISYEIVKNKLIFSISAP
jgi:hypothetical protein